MNTRGRKRAHHELGLDDDDENIDRNNLEENSVGAKRSKTIPRILDGTFFSIVSNNEGKIEAECTQCKEIRKGILSTTGNFKSHYRNKHSSMVSALESYLNGQTIDQKSGRQTTLTEFKSAMNPQKVSY